MDYPKSVPGVGLVDGKFVDEDAVLGRQGSLIPAAWGSAVTEELLGVIEGLGEAPSEADFGQLARLLLRNPTEVQRGMPLVATAEEALAGVNAGKMLTPAGLTAAFSGVRYVTGGGELPWILVILPNGFRILSGSVGTPIAGGGAITLTYPIAFPNKAVSLILTSWANSAGGGIIGHTSRSASSAGIYNKSAATIAGFDFLILGD